MTRRFFALRRFESAGKLPSTAPILRLFAGAFLLSMAVLLAGCSDSSSPPSSQPPPAANADGDETATQPADAKAPVVDACALVSKQDAERVVGTPLDDAIPARESCTYTGPVTGPTAQVEVFVGDGAKKILDIDRELGHELQQLSGVGDEAYMEDGAVFLRKANLWVAVRIVRLVDFSEYSKQLQDLARTVAGRI